MRDVLEHSTFVTSAVHDELIRWVQDILKNAGLEAVDVWGRFPPEGTVRSHLVLFPYRVGPEPKNLENSRGGSIMREDAYPSDRFGRVPPAWRELGKLMLRATEVIWPEAGQLDTPRRPQVLPFPLVENLPKPLQGWYEEHGHTKDGDPFVIEDDGDLYARPPSLGWKPGVGIWAHYIAVAGDAGRGVSDRTSDAPPLSLSALSALTVGIHMERTIKVELPAMPFDPKLNEFILAMYEGLDEVEHEEAGELKEQLGTVIEQLRSTASYNFSIIPMHDLSMHEFALLTQALQRPLQAVLNFRIVFTLGSLPDFRPAVVVSMRHARNGGSDRDQARRERRRR